MRHLNKGWWFLNSLPSTASSTTFENTSYTWHYLAKSTAVWPAEEGICSTSYPFKEMIWWTIYQAFEVIALSNQLRPSLSVISSTLKLKTLKVLIESFSIAI